MKKKEKRKTSKDLNYAFKHEMHLFKKTCQVSWHINASRVTRRINTSRLPEPADTLVTDVVAREWAAGMAQISPMRSACRALDAFGPTDLQLNRAVRSNNKADHMSNL